MKQRKTGDGATPGAGQSRYTLRDSFSSTPAGGRAYNVWRAARGRVADAPLNRKAGPPVGRATRRAPAAAAGIERPVRHRAGFGPAAPAEPGDAEPHADASAAADRHAVPRLFERVELRLPRPVRRAAAGQ